VDRQATGRVLGFDQVHILNDAHAREHSLEVQLPFLQQSLHQFTLVPLLVGQATPEEVAEPLEAIWGAAETLIVVSSDLSHYHDYETAQRMDRRTSEAIEDLRWQDIGPQEACGCGVINGLLYLARKLGLRVSTLDLRNSADTYGPRAEVVGYGAYVFDEPASIPTRKE
jgi:AmmeMemoRadiSam system protein B